MFEKVIEWIKANAAEGADIAELEAMLPNTEAILQVPEIRSALDSAVSKAVQSHDKRFTDEKLPTLLDEERAKIRAELNPEETAEQKRIRELEERLQKADRERETRERRDKLRKKASELGISEIGLTPDDVETFVAFGDDAETTLEAYVGRTKEAMTSQLDNLLKERFGDNAPPRKGPEDDADEKHGEEYVAERMQGSWLH